MSYANLLIRNTFPKYTISFSGSFRLITACSFKMDLSFECSGTLKSPLLSIITSLKTHLLIIRMAYLKVFYVSLSLWHD